MGKHRLKGNSNTLKVSVIGQGVVLNESTQRKFKCIFCLEFTQKYHKSTCVCWPGMLNMEWKVMASYFFHNGYYFVARKYPYVQQV